MLLSAKNLCKKYLYRIILENISLEIHQGEMVAIIGPSGSGKSTLLKILATFDKPNNGAVYFQERNLFDLNNRELAVFRNQSMGFVFQEHHLLNELTVLENICIPGYIKNSPREKILKEACKLLDFFNIKDQAYQKPHELSGGEQQKVAVARALINKPQIIFADEPTGSLDEKSANDLHQLFLKLRHTFQQTFVFVTHNMQFAEMADRKLTIRNAKIVF